MVRRAILLIGVIALVAMMLQIERRGAPIATTAMPLHATNSPAVPTILSYFPADSQPPVIPTDSLEVPSTFEETPADPWANAILDQIVAALEGRNPVSAPALSTYKGLLGLEEGDLLVGTHRLTMDSLSIINLVVIDPQDAEHSLLLGEIAVDRGVLILDSFGAITSEESREWRLSGAATSLAIDSLLAQAHLRNIQLEASLRPGIAGEVQLGIYRASHSTVSPTTSTGAVTQSPIRISPSPTRSPDIVMGRIIAAKLDPVIDLLQEQPPVLTEEYLDRHARSGILTATETDIQISGRSIPVDEALNLTIYRIDTMSADDSIVRLLSVYYSNEAITRFPEEQIYFQGHRMREVLYWMVIHAVERGGQLIVGYDELNQIQAVTIIGFMKFSEPR